MARQPAPLTRGRGGESAAVQFRNAVDEGRQLLRARVVVPVPRLVQRRVAQPEVAAQVDDAVAQRLQRPQAVLRHAVGQGEEEDVAILQLVHADEFKARLLAKIGMNLVQELPPVALRRHLRQFHRRVLQEQPHQFAADVTGAPRRPLP